MGTLGFASPLLLLALLGLPLLWWLLRATPPAPTERAFGGTEFLRRLRDQKETPARTPLLVLLIRLLAAALLIIGLSGPVLNRPSAARTDAPLLIVLDDGWTAATRWRDRQDAALREAARPGAAGREAWLLTTATDRPSMQGPMTIGEAARLVEGRVPQPRLPNHAAAAAALAEAALGDADVLWIAGTAEGSRARQDLARTLNALGSVRLFRLPGEETVAVGGLSADGPSLTATLARDVAGGGREGALRVIARDGRTLTTTPFAFAPGETRAEAVIDLPLSLRNQAAVLSVEGQRSAGATWLVDASARRVRAGLVTDGAEDSLLTSATYLTQALSPLALLSRGTPEALAQDGMDVIVLDDVGTLRPDAEEALGEWIRAGGLLVRFAGPDTANAPDSTGDTFTAPLRGGGRSFGGALTWETPQPIAGFDEGSPLAGLAVPTEAEVRRQVLLRAGPEAADASAWAYLADGTPLVTARPVGEGLVVLFHVTASPTWSDLPLSGAFPAIMRRVLSLSGRSGLPERAEARGPLPALRLLDGYGRLSEPATTAPPLVPGAEGAAPGLYGQQDAPVAVNAWPGKPALVPPTRAMPAAFTITGPEGARVRELGPPLIAVALLLLALDALVTTLLSGGLKRGAPAAAAIGLAVLASPPAEAQNAPRPPLDPKAVEAAELTRFAYVLTGDPATDRISEAGLFGLARETIRRSALEPGAPVGVDLERDDLSVYPLLYWPITLTGNDPSDAALSKVEAYMAGGGLIVIDTRDGERASAGARTPQRDRLRALLRRIDTPPLEPLPDGHILGLSFYRMDDLPGRNSGGPVWVEAASALRETTDGVPSLIVGGRDWASAWAVDEGGVPLRPAGPGGEGRREMAYRAGVNMAMVALTGSYKGDQIHVQELLDRLGEEAP